MSDEHIKSFHLSAVNLPLRISFKHSAAERQMSESIFLKCVTSSGVGGFGEALPRLYVTGETVDGVYDLLADKVLPCLIGRSFEDLAGVESFLAGCDGRAPREWVDPGTPQGAAWCAVDLALLDAFGKTFGNKPLSEVSDGFPKGLRYSAVLSAEKGWKRDAMLLGYRLLGFRQIKLKVGADTTRDTIRRIHMVAGPRMALRTDANMGWAVDDATDRIREFEEFGVESHEQPVDPADLEGMSHLVRETVADIMADESFTTKESLDELIARRACTAVNARISKCGGLVATRNRCREALAAGLKVQIGCQVGESSLLSAAHLLLCAAVRDVRYAEGCFGRLLLKDDPVSPEIRFRWGGKPPVMPPGAGLGVTVNEERLRIYTVRECHVE